MLEIFHSREACERLPCAAFTSSCICTTALSTHRKHSFLSHHNVSIGYNVMALAVIMCNVRNISFTRSVRAAAVRRIHQLLYMHDGVIHTPKAFVSVSS